MEGDTPDAKKNEDQLMNANHNVSPSSLYSSSKSRNLLRKKDGRCLAVLSSGKCLQIFKNSPKVSCSDELSTSSPTHFSRKLGANYKADQSRKVISLPSNNTFSSPSTDVSQGTLQFTMRANGMPRFVFKLDNQEDVYVASLSSNNVDDQSVLEYSYMIHLQRGESSSSSSVLVGRIKVSTLSSGSSLNERFIERQFILFSNNGEHLKSPCQKKNRGLSKKVVDMMKSNEQIQQPNFDHEQVSLLENNFPPNLETLAIVVKQEFLEEEETGGWGLKFLKKSSLFQTESGSSLTSMDVVIPSGIHGGPEDGPSSLIERWKSQGNCDCGGWDLGCSLTLLKSRQQRKDNLLELFIETKALRIEKLRRGRYFVQFQTWLSVLRSFSIAIAFIHSQSKELRQMNI
ncbi:hypothetical protein Bca101_044701 [Brassica carinata]